MTEPAEPAASASEGGARGAPTPGEDPGSEEARPAPDEVAVEGEALPGGADEVQPLVGVPASLGRAARTVFLRALCLGSLVALAFCVVVYLGPGVLDLEGVLRSGALGAAVGLFAIGVPSGIESWLATWPEVKRARGFLLLYLGGLIGWLASGVQFGYLYYVREGRELSEALVLSVQTALEATPPLLVFHALLPVALALASLRRLRWVIPGRGGAWRWVYLGLLGCTVGAFLVPGSWGRLLNLPLILVGLAVVLTLAYYVIHALQVGLRPDDAVGSQEFVVGVEVGPGEPPTLGERLLLGGDTNMVAGTVAWAGLGLLWARLGGHGVVVIVSTLTCWLLHVIVASNLPSILLAKGKPERALALARHLLRSRTGGRWAAQAKTVRLYRETEVRALLALGRSEEALRYLPEALGEVLEGLPDIMARLRLATALAAAGFAELCLEVLAPIPRGEATRTGTELQAESLESVALNALDRPREAYDKAEPLLGHPLAARGRVRAVILNNLAVYQVRLGRDLDLAQERAEEAGRLLPTLVQTRSTLGAVLLAKGEAAAARPLLEAGLEGAFSPHSRAWVGERLGRCYLDLGELELAREAFSGSAEAGPGTEAGRAAAAELAADPAPGGSLPLGSP